MNTSFTQATTARPPTHELNLLLLAARQTAHLEDCEEAVAVSSERLRG